MLIAHSEFIAITKTSNSKGLPVSCTDSLLPRVHNIINSCFYLNSNYLIPFSIATYLKVTINIKLAIWCRILGATGTRTQEMEATNGILSKLAKK